MFVLYNKKCKTPWPANPIAPFPDIWADTSSIPRFVYLKIYPYPPLYIRKYFRILLCIFGNILTLRQHWQHWEATLPLIFSNADPWRRRLKLGFGCMTPLKEGWGENREFVRFMRKMQSAIALKNATTADRVGTDMQKGLKTHKSVNIHQWRAQVRGFGKCWQ